MTGLAPMMELPMQSWKKMRDPDAMDDIVFSFLALTKTWWMPRELFSSDLHFQNVDARTIKTLFPLIYISKNKNFDYLRHYLQIRRPARWDSQHLIRLARSPLWSPRQIPTCTMDDRTSRMCEKSFLKVRRSMIWSSKLHNIRAVFEESEPSLRSGQSRQCGSCLRCESYCLLARRLFHAFEFETDIPLIVCI